MKKIGFYITSEGWGGLEMNILRLASWLNERGFQVVVFTKDSSRLKAEADEIFLTMKFITKDGIHQSLIGSFYISSQLKSEGIKTLFVFTNRDLKQIHLVKRFFFRSLKVIYQQHMQIGINKRDLFHTLRYSCINHWISPLNYLKEEVINMTRFPEKNISVIPLGIDINDFLKNNISKAEARERINISSATILIGIIGRITRKKGQLFLVKALHRLNEKGIDSELLIFGSPTINYDDDKKYLAEIKEYINLNNLGSKVHFREFSRDVSLFYNSIDIFVLASESETYGMVTIESMLSGVPVIATNTGGTPELLKNGELGFLYNYNDIDSFSRSFSFLNNNKEETSHKAIIAREYAIQQFSHINECNMIEKLLERI